VTDNEQQTTETDGRIALSEGADVYGSDGERWGQAEDVGAKYLKIVEGLLGTKAWYLPVALVACGDTDRAELTVPIAEAKEQALTEEPEDEPIYRESEPIAVGSLETAGIPEPEPTRERQY
jgi:hypothetical protein